MTLDVITSDDLTPGKHGYFTNRGGVSEGIYASLNCGAGSNDDSAAVQENRARVGGFYGYDARAVVSVHQVHSADVVVINGPHEDAPPKCDAMVCTAPGIVLGALSADCAPVLFEDRQAGVVAAAHAGWRGALAGVVAATVDQMVMCGATRNAIRGSVGPCLSQRNYEVGPEFFEDFCLEDPNHSRYFAGGTGDRMQFDLPGFVLGRLHASGICAASWTGQCTYDDPSRFFSYRRGCHQNLPDYGRLIATITL